MLSFNRGAALLGLACVMLPTAGNAAEDIATLRAELQALSAEYTERVAALETRITQLEAAATTPAATAPQAAQSSPSDAAVPAPIGTPAMSGGGRNTAFNPAMSLI